MKLLNSLPSVIDEQQLKSLQNFLFKEADLRHVVWENVLDDVIKNFEDLDFGRTFYLERFDFNKMSKELQSIFISTVALLKEDAVINDTISRHEMIHKDEVKALNDISKKVIGILSGADERNYNKNVEVKNNILALIPNNIQHFNPIEINVQYYPSSLEYIIGNIPNNDNVRAGTFGGYWSADIYTNRRIPAGAIVTLNYPSVIHFNNINFRGASTYPSSLNKLEYYDDIAETWVDITPTTEYSKDFYITFDTSYMTTSIRMDISQPHYDYVWKKEVNDAFIIRDIVIAGRDITNIKNNRIENVITDGPFELINRDIIENKFKYEVGAYNIQVFLKTYINEDGSFRTKEFTVEDVINDIKILATDSVFGDKEYRIIQSDNSYLEYTGPGANPDITNIPLEVKVPVIKDWYKTEKFSELMSNKIKLENYPFIELPSKEITLKIDGSDATYVEKFTGANKLEFIVVGNIVYANADLKGKVVSVQYWHKTKSAILEVTLNTGADGYSFASPEVTFLDLEINGVSQS